MPPIRIADVMRQEHIRLANMLGDLITNITKGSKDSFKKFIQLKWNVEKHFFIEEKAIFEAYSDKVEVDNKEIRLIEEHKQMIEMILNAKKMMEQGKVPDFTEFQKFMLKHQKIEDEHFYTGLENNLTEDEKAEILDKTREIIKV